MNISFWLKLALKQKKFDKNINHEVYTLLIVDKIFQYKEEFLSTKMGQDICAVLDTSIPPHPEGDLAKSKLQFLFHEIISGEIDVDRMDYLLRDSRECGVVYGYFDLGRILDSLGFYLNSTTQQHHLALRKSGISAYEDYLRARLSMYHQVYFHKTATACEAMLESLKRKLPHFSFPLDIDSYTSIDDYNIFEYFKSFDTNSKNLMFIKDLLFNRKLWKRVYEESDSLHCHTIIALLEELKIPAQLIESSTNLTRFSPRGRGVSKNNFKVILKNVNSTRYLEPIENHSNLINSIDEELMVRRIFIARSEEAGKDIDVNLIQKIISERIATK